jgi:DNA mismatch repair ATPase MutS
MKRLDRLSTMADVRFSPMLYLPLQAMFLWSFYVLHGLERWQEKAGKNVCRWFGALGEIDALLGLSGLAHDHPHWQFPTITKENSQTIKAKNLGHPLLHPGSCVTNDVTIGPSGTFQMITGSNMSGKSTLLRAVGLNVVLAQAGGPVFAESLVMPPVVLGTSFRIQDSLQAGVSFFMAELKRLKEIVDLARECGQKDPGMFLYLLDEILQGTNVAERQVAVRSVVITLLENNAIGAVSTHDLSLAEAPGLEDPCQPFHFTETYQAGPDGPAMHFDYTLRPGIAPTVNALKLLEIVGLEQK